MKKQFVAVLLVALSAAAHADFTAGSSQLAVFGGFGGSSDRYDFGGRKDEAVTRPGGAFGAQYLYYLMGTPGFAIGFDGNVSLNNDRHTGDLLNGASATTRLKSVIGLFIARLSFPKGTFRPYVFGGLGVGRGSLFVSAKPTFGNAWSDGGTDSRVLIDEKETSPAVAGGVGLDIFPTESFFFGVELRGTWLGTLEPRETAEARALGFELRDTEAVSQGNAFLRMGLKF
jgi:hypothetical protein